VLETAVYGCGNSILTRAVTLKGPAPFDPAADLTGGEDDRLFVALRAAGARFAWAADAVVYEHAPAHRARLAYTFTRALGYGQSPAQICARRRDWIGVGGWMLVGAGQAIVYGAMAAALWAFRRPSRYRYADKAMQGVGKVLWSTRLRFYGLAGVSGSETPGDG
jgi:hypothetical protein